MILAPILSSASLTYDCENSDYLVENYGHDGEDEFNTCNDDKAAEKQGNALSYPNAVCNKYSLSQIIPQQHSDSVLLSGNLDK